jgi:hypothetical protein
MAECLPVYTLCCLFVSSKLSSGVTGLLQVCTCRVFCVALPSTSLSSSPRHRQTVLLGVEALPSGARDILSLTTLVVVTLGRSP